MVPAQPAVCVAPCGERKEACSRRSERNLSTQRRGIRRLYNCAPTQAPSAAVNNIATPRLNRFTRIRRRIATKTATRPQSGYDGRCRLVLTRIYIRKRSNISKVYAYIYLVNGSHSIVHVNRRMRQKRSPTLMRIAKTLMVSAVRTRLHVSIPISLRK